MKRSDLDQLLQHLLTLHPKGVSDINFTPFRPLQAEVRGVLTAIPCAPALAFGYLSPFQTAQIAMRLIDHHPTALKELAVAGSADLAYAVPNLARFRVNIFRSQGAISIVLRKLETVIPRLEELKSPAIFREIAKEPNGLILVTGATGSGKSTTLAAILRQINEERAVHIVSLEDPIEYVHSSIKATFNQREQGSDFDTFPNGLRAALRQAPKIIHVGEMRDRASMEIGLKAAETGHLVLTTLHTVDAGQTISRIIGMFDKEEEQQIRIRLAATLRWVICQRLVRGNDGERIAVHEIMGSNLRTNELILIGEDERKTYYNVIEASQALGWQTFESNLLRLYREGRISEETAMLNTTRRSVMRQNIDHVKSAKGEQTSDLTNLALDKDYVTRIKG
jgi:twitching motility protein PilT